MKAEAAMRLALSQARRARGRSFPNPPVGAVVYRGDRGLGRGYTRPVGGAHAEVVAIERAVARHGARAVRGAALAVTLEPCAHTGRTPPCAKRILDAGIARVVVGHGDPHDQVAGRGIRRLRRSGVRVEIGVLESACREQHRGFLSSVLRGRPFVMLKLASSLDGRIATARGESRWITGPESRAAVHRLRARVDALVIGAATARADDPELTARRGDTVVHWPVRVVADPDLSVPATARLYAATAGEAWALCGSRPPAARRRALEARGARVLPVRRVGRSLDLRAGLRRLARAGLSEILVEGGGQLAASLLRAGLVDELHWFTAPRLLGGDARPALGALDVRKLARSPQLAELRVKRLGDDVHWVGTLATPGETGL
ncbi:MAG: bifunctional diaminohydroxyphosphoribosylaminopyrimidine deaminase/5-amino-6-(5-phosphoribosylamino)uracil reductase RibD [Myxococcota bacterium]|nr:bifunctional diaminohydroxyphosphoribosylaminopyrimidine deaminase/5-amino-6-(5-phosphoribosylamino)uracil reductase RibD [Myxococcota bacterium]